MYQNRILSTEEVIWKQQLNQLTIFTNRHSKINSKGDAKSSQKYESMIKVEIVTTIVITIVLVMEGKVTTIISITFSKIEYS